MMPYEDFDVLERRVREMVGRHALPPEVSRVEVWFGELRDGDPAVRVELYLSEDRDPGPEDGEMWADLTLALSQGAREVVPGRSASTRLLLDGRQPG